MSDQGEHSAGIAGTPVIIDDRAFCFWDRNDNRTQMQFLDSIDPSYFRYLVEINEPQLNGPNRAKAAMALRIAYSHVLESLFAFIGAAVQAPTCSAGWLLKYSNERLVAFVRNVSDRAEVLNHVNLGQPGWDGVADALFPWDRTIESLLELRNASQILWKALAREFLDRSFTDEYNSLKHGFRVHSGPWSFSIGVEDVPGVPAAPEKMHQMASSSFGSSFFRAIEVDNQHKHHLAFEKQRVNWNPSVYAKRIPLIAGSIENVLSFLKWANGSNVEGLRCCLFDSDSVTDALIDPDHSSSTRFSMRVGITEDMIVTPSKSEILQKYKDDMKASEPAS